MRHADLIRERLGSTLKKIGRECLLDRGFILLPEWNLRIYVVEGESKEGPERVLILPSIMALHPYFPNGCARELAVGVGVTLDKAVQSIVSNWLLLFFPLLKFVFDENPHDCTVNERDIQGPSDGQSQYRLIEGPVSMVGFDVSIPTQMSQSKIWDSFSDLLLADLKYGVHHIRCYVCRMQDRIDADIFVDGVEWREGSERLRELAGGFPVADAKHPIYSLKQHILLLPSDLALNYELERKGLLAKWSAVLDNQLSGNDRELLPHVLRGMFVLSHHLGLSELECEKLLFSEGMSREIAAKIVTFLPSAAARVLMKGKVEFPEDYRWTNYHTRQFVVQRYDQTPVFMASMHAFELLHQHGLAGPEIRSVADYSVEMKGIAKVRQQGGKLEGGKLFTSMTVMTEEQIPATPTPVPPLSPEQSKPEVRQRRKPWWKLW
jgi:hypothetical protein